MVEIYIDPAKHYRVSTKHTAENPAVDYIEIHEFPEECPVMKEREEFSENDAKLIFTVSSENCAEFFIKSDIFILSIPVPNSRIIIGDIQVLDLGIFCGDDFVESFKDCRKKSFENYRKEIGK